MKEYSITITTLPNGKYKYTQKYLDPYASKLGSLKYRSVSCTLTKNTKQAQSKARAILKDKIDHKLAKLGLHDLSIKELYRMYLDHYDLSKKDAELDPTYQTNYNYQQHLKKFVAFIDQDRLLSTFDVPFFHQYFDDLLKKYSYSYCNVRRAAINHLFTFGVDFGYLKSNPLVGFKLKKQRLDTVNLIENKYLTDQEYQSIIAFLQSKKRYDYADFFQVMYLTGLRLSEASGLKVSDFKKIDHTWSLVIDGILVKKHDAATNFKAKKRQSTKTNAGMRVVYLPIKAVDIIKQKIKGKNPNDLIFTKQGTDSMPFSTSDVNYYLKRITKKLGISKNVTSHYFRHTHISKLASMGVPLADIKKHVGHESAKTTEQIYYHVLSQNKDNLESMIDTL